MDVFDMNSADINFNLDPIIGSFVKQNKMYKNHPLAPQNAFRALLVGSSNSGKSNALIMMIIKNLLRFDKLWLFARDVSQDKYQFLIRYMRQLEEDYRIEKNLKKEDAVSFFEVISDSKMIPDVSELDPKVTNLVVFDDMVSEDNRGTIEGYFLHGRHRSASILYCTQDYHSVLKPIRLQCQYFFFWSIKSNKELNLIAAECGLVMDKDQFKKAFKEATSIPYNFLLVDNKTTDKRLRIRSGLDGIMTAEDIKDRERL